MFLGSSFCLFALSGTLQQKCVTRVNRAKCQRSSMAMWTQVSSTFFSKSAGSAEGTGGERQGKAWGGICIIFHGCCKLNGIKAWCGYNNMKCHEMNISNSFVITMPDSLFCPHQLILDANLFVLSSCEGRMRFIFEYASAKLKRQERYYTKYGQRI